MSIKPNLPLHVDIHTNLGQFPKSGKKSSIITQVSVPKMVKFLRNENITHHVCLYPRDDYALLEELAAKAPEITHYGVQVIAGNSSSNPTDIKNVSLDILDPKKPLCKGIKLMSHRGWWLRKGVVEAGLDYGVYSRDISSLLNRLPHSALVSMHLQGEPANNCGAVPMVVAKFALKYPHLKFIMNHAGEFGQGSICRGSKKFLWEKYGPIFAFRYAHGRAVVDACVQYANNTHNLWIDSSSFYPSKAELLPKTKKWCVGSDYPFMPWFKLQENQFAKRISGGHEYLQERYKDTIHWIEADWHTLYKEHVVEKNYEDDVNLYSPTKIFVIKKNNP